MNTRTTCGWAPKTAATIAFALVATLALAGCGGGSGGGGTTGTTGIAGLASAGGGALDEYVMITLTPLGGTMPFAAQTDGTYAVEVPAGTYTLGATRPGYEDYTSGTLTVVDGEVLVHNIPMVALLAGQYIGTDACGACHEAIMDLHMQSGHPWKISKVEGVAPFRPFTDVSPALALLGDDDADIMGGLADPGVGTDNPEGTPTSWSDITYMIGGYHWKARFIGASGEIVTGTSVQYNLVIPDGNLTAATISAYHNNENDKSFNCGNCHTTGWQRADAMVNGGARQDGLAGMDGTFTEGGVRCEACHGAGSTHAQTELASDITRIAQFRQLADFTDGSLGKGKPIHCGECHTRDGERDYPTFISAAEAAGWVGDANWPAGGGRIAASGGLVRHHEQYDEVLGLDPNETSPGVYGTPLATRSAPYAGAHGNCRTCHDNSHASTVNRDNPQYAGPAGVDDSNAACLQCHASAIYDPANAFRGSMSNLECVDCHMPKTAKSATSVTLPNGVLRGDVTSHIFSIDISGAPAATTDGKFRYPYLTIDQACRQCHYSGGPGFFDVPTAPMNWNGFHTNQNPTLTK